MPRYQTTVRLSPEAKRGWWSAKQGQSFTALVEAVGLALDDGTLVLPPEFVAKAGAIDVARGSR